MDGTGYLLEVHRREMQEVEQQSAKLAHKRREEEASLNEQFEEFRRAVALPQPAQDNSKNVFHRAYAALAAAMFAASMILLQ